MEIALHVLGRLKRAKYNVSLDNSSFMIESITVLGGFPIVKMNTKELNIK